MPRGPPPSRGMGPGSGRGFRRAWRSPGERGLARAVGARRKLGLRARRGGGRGAQSVPAPGRRPVEEAKGVGPGPPREAADRGREVEVGEGPWHGGQRCACGGGPQLRAWGPRREPGALRELWPCCLPVHHSVLRPRPQAGRSAPGGARPPFGGGGGQVARGGGAGGVLRARNAPARLAARQRGGVL